MHYNSEQQEVILHKDGPALVLAGPGSGKTAVLTARIEVLIRHYHIPPSQILVLSFTRAASREIESRFQSRTGEKSVTFGTIHAVFYRILKISRPQTASLVIPSSVRRQYIREYLLEEAGWEEAAREKVEQIETELLRGEKEQPGEDPAGGDVDLAAVRSYYERRKRENGLLDFTDILRDCLKFLESDEEARNWWRKRFRYVMVDEYQDVSPLQQRLLKALTGPDGNLLAVGDEDQSIYAFRGSDSESVLRFDREFPGAARYALVRCYRCSPQILRSARILIAHNAKRYPKALVSEAEPGEEPVLQVFEDHPSEMRAVAEEIRKALEGGCEADRIAVLARTRFSLRRMAAALIRENILCHITEKLDSDYEAECAGDLFAYLRLGEGSAARADWLRILNRPLRYLPRRLFTSETVDREALWEEAAGQNFSAALLRLFYDLDRLRDLRPYAAIEYIRNEMGYDAFMKKHREEKGRLFEEEAALMDRLQEESAPFETAGAWEKARKLMEKERGGDREDRDPVPGVRILTMHGSKGLEFERVFLPSLNEGELPGRKAVGTDAVEEERRLFYVAMTRASRFLWLSFVRKDRGKKVLPSRFLGEITEGERMQTRRRKER